MESLGERESHMCCLVSLSWIQNLSTDKKRDNGHFHKLSSFEDVLPSEYGDCWLLNEVWQRVSSCLLEENTSFYVEINESSKSRNVSPTRVPNTSWTECFLIFCEIPTFHDKVCGSAIRLFLAIIFHGWAGQGSSVTWAAWAGWWELVMSLKRSLRKKRVKSHIEFLELQIKRLNSCVISTSTFVGWLVFFHHLFSSNM